MANDRTLELPKPRDIANDLSPNFAQLVFRYLPYDKWDERYTRAKFTSSGRIIPGPDTSIIDSYQYELLLKVPDCDKSKLEIAWAEWRRLGEYKNGEEQRKNLFHTSRDHGERWLLYHSIRDGLASTGRARRAFEDVWSASALDEMQENSDWEMWQGVEEMLEESAVEPERRIAGVNDGDYFHPKNPEECLGSRCYAALE